MNLGICNVLENRITACDYAFILEKIKNAIDEKKSLLISPIASQTLVKAYYNNALKNILDRFDYLVPDSQWVKRSLWFLYGIHLKERVYGPELMLKTCELAQKKEYSIYLYGGPANTLKLLERQLHNMFPKITIIGTKPSVFRELNNQEQQQLIKEIVDVKPHLIFISLGSPKQEEFSVWISNKIKDQHTAVIIPTGAAFDFIRGNKPQAPKLMGDLGFEWLFRLIHEPKRLWKRYIIDGVLFIYLILIQKINGTKKNS